MKRAGGDLELTARREKGRDRRWTFRRIEGGRIIRESGPRKEVLAIMDIR